MEQNVCLSEGRELNKVGRFVYVHIQYQKEMVKGGPQSMPIIQALLKDYDLINIAAK